MSGEEPSLTTVGQRLRHARLTKTPAISVVEAAAAIGLKTDVTVYRYEQDKEDAPLRRLLMLAELYAVDAVWLVFGRGHARGNDSVSRYLASPMAGLVAEDVAERLGRLPYDLFGYREPDESDVAHLRHSLELHLARAKTKSPAGGQPTQTDLSPTVPKRGRKRTKRSD